MTTIVGFTQRNIRVLERQIENAARTDKAHNSRYGRSAFKIHCDSLAMIVSKRGAFMRMGNAQRDIRTELIQKVKFLSQFDIRADKSVYKIIANAAKFGVYMERKKQKYNILLTIGQMRMINGMVRIAKEGNWTPRDTAIPPPPKDTRDDFIRKRGPQGDFE